MSNRKSKIAVSGWIEGLESLPRLGQRARGMLLEGGGPSARAGSRCQNSHNTDEIQAWAIVLCLDVFDLSQNFIFYDVNI